MGHDHNAGGRTEIGTRAVVVRDGSGRAPERHTVVDESDRTVTLDDGSRFARADGLLWGHSGDDDEPAPVHVVTEGGPDFEELWADAVLASFTDLDRLRWVEDAMAAGLPGAGRDVHARYDVAAVVDELSTLGEDFDDIPGDVFRAVVAHHRRISGPEE